MAKSLKRVVNAVSSSVSTLARLFESSPGKTAGDARVAAPVSPEVRKLQGRLDQVYAELARGRSALDVTAWLARAAELEAEVRAARLAAVKAGRARPRPAAPAPKPRAETPDARRMAGALNKVVASLRLRDSSQRLLFGRLCEDLLSPRSELRLSAARRLADVAQPDVRRVLEIVAREGDDELRVAALDGLGRIRDKASRPVFEQLLAHPSHRVRLAALRGLLGVGGGEVIPHFVRALADEHPALRRAAVTYLGWLKADSAASRVARLLRDPYAEVREAAAGALADIGSDATVFSLLCTLGDSEEAVRRGAEDALTRILGDPVAFDPDAAENERSRQIAGLKSWWREERVPYLLKRAELLVGKTAQQAQPPRAATVTSEAQKLVGTIQERSRTKPAESTKAAATPAPAKEPPPPEPAPEAPATLDEGLPPGFDGLVPLGESEPGEPLGTPGDESPLGIEGIEGLAGLEPAEPDANEDKK